MDSKINKIIVLYKKDCGFCTTCKVFSKKRNKKNNLDFIDIYSQEAKEVFSNNGLGENFSTIWIFENDEIYKQSKAVFVIAQNLSLPWKILSYGYFLLPKNWWDFLYAFFAKKISKTKICKK